MFVVPAPKRKPVMPMVSLLTIPDLVPETTKRTGLLLLPSFIKLALTSSPELLIARRKPSTVLLELSIVMVTVLSPTPISNVPFGMVLEVEAKPSETSFVSRARLLTVKEKVPEVARLLVLKLTTEFVSRALLLEKVQFYQWEYF